DLELHVERRIEAIDFEILAEGLGEEDTAADEDLGEPDRGDRENQSRGLEEPADDERLDEDPEQDRRHESRREGKEVVDAERDDQEHAERGRHLAEVAL